MANHVEYTIDTELDDYLQDTLKSDPQYLPIIDHVKVSACFLVRVDDDGEPVESKTDPIAIKKVSKETAIFTRSDVQYIVVVDKCFWDDVDSKRKLGEMCRALTRFDVQQSEEGIKVRLRKFDVQDFAHNIKRHGAYNPSLEVVRNAFREQLLGAAERAIAAAATSKATDDEAPVRKPARLAAPTKAKSKPTDDEPDNDDEPEERPRVKSYTADKDSSDDQD